jgi:predicted dehydrogenase
VTRDRVELAIIGGGMMSQVGHLPFYIADPRCDVAAVAESRPSLIAALGTRYDGLRVVRNYRDVLEDPAIIAVVIIAPRPAMAPLAFEVLHAGKHVLMEKPMAGSVEQAQRLLAAAREANVTLAVGFMKRYDGGVQAARAVFGELMATRRLGRLLFARFYDYAKVYALPPPPHKRPEESRAERFAEWPLWPEWLPEKHRDAYAWFMNAASHDLNLMHFFFPQGLTVIDGTAQSGEAVIGTLTADDVPVALEIVKSGPGLWLEGIEFLFEKGRLAIQIPSPMATDRCAQVTLQENEMAPREIVIEGNAGWSFERQAHGFIDILTGDARPLTSGEDGLRDIQLCESLWRKISERSNG